MVWAILGLSLVALGFAGTAAALGIRVGKLTSDRDAFRLERDVALKAQRMHASRVEELSAVVFGRGKELESLRNELATCGDPVTRSRLAVDGIARLLSPMPEAGKEADTDHD